MSVAGEVVQSVGNSWIICRSKTHAGRIYYFNTLTGEAAWNLSESEIEKAKKRTSILESQSGFPVDNCPEPMESPKDYPSEMPSHSNQQIPSRNGSFKVYNNQIINNQYSKLQYKIPGQLSNISALSPIQLNLPITPTLSPGIWNVQSHPIFITSNSISPQPVLSNAVDNYDYVPVAKTSVPLTNRFKSLDQNKNNLHRKTQFGTGNSYGVRKKQYRNRFHNWSNKKDLRLLLSSKKRKSERSPNQISQEKRDNFHLISCDDNDELWLETNLRTQRFNALLDISALKKLLQVENNFKVWYIVVDTNVLLKNINFLNILLNSDNQCCLMVPHIVMDEIQMATNSLLRTQAHRAAYFISQQVDAKIAVIEQLKLEYNDNREAIMDCCAKLVNQGYEVVLLTDDIQLHNLENTASFLIFTVRQMKKILLKTNSCGSITNNPEELALKQKRNIKVTIPNDVNKIFFDHIQQNRDETDTVLSYDACNDEDSISKDGSSIQLPVEDSVQSNQIQKNTDDVVVHANSSELNAIYESNDQNVDTFLSSNNLKAKKIRLKRNSSNDFNSSNNTRSKTWYKRRSQTSFTHTLCNSNVSENVQRDIGTMTEKSCQNSCGDLSLESMKSFHPCNYEESSESSNAKARKNCGKSYVIDEKSASERSNVHSIVNMENDQSISKRSTEVVKEQFISKSCDNRDENVMFEVTSKDMEDILKMKCDEWISRFVQIIEEASSQVLHQDPPFILDTMLPPWTIYEAAECIKRKFSYDNDTVDAANKLLNVLFEIGGLRGKIKIDINPNKYMEMYSYGVYLIDALQGLISNSEDLQIAAESLSKLLTDIQDSHLNPGNQDSFNDDHIHNQDTTVNISVCKHIVNETRDKTCNATEITDNVSSDNYENVEPNESENIQKVSNTSPVRSTFLESTSGKYRLRSHRKKLLQEKEELPEKTTFIRNIDLKTSFFKSLHLKKKIGTKATESVNQDINIENLEEVQISNTESNLENVNETNKKIDSTLSEDIASNEPKIIRNFVKCPEFEDKIQNKSSFVYDSWTNKNQSELEYTDSEQNDYEFLEDGYYCGNDYDFEYEYETIDAEEASGENLYNDEEKHLNTEIHNINFKAVIQKIQHNIKETFLSVHGFCEKCYSTLSSDNGYSEKNDIQHLAEKTHSYLNDLCDALTSVLSRETSNSIYKMQELLKVEEFKDIIVEDGDLEGYRNFITQCLEQGSILKDSVKLIIKATRE